MIILDLKNTIMNMTKILTQISTRKFNRYMIELNTKIILTTFFKRQDQFSIFTIRGCPIKVPQ